MLNSFMSVWTVFIAPETSNLLAIAKFADAFVTVDFGDTSFCLPFHGWMFWLIWILLFFLLLFLFFSLGGCICLLPDSAFLDMVRFKVTRTRRRTTIITLLNTCFVAIITIGNLVVILVPVVVVTIAILKLQCIELPGNGLDKIGKLRL